MNSGCLLPVAVVGMLCWFQSGSHRPRNRAPRTEGLTPAEVIPGLGEGCGQPGQPPVRHPIKLGVLCPGVRETALAEGGGPCSLAVFFNLAPKFTQGNVFIFLRTLERGKEDPVHCRGPSSLLPLSPS